jgi:inorganic pyrophosphatase
MIIFINGSINSGKSTIAKLLAKKISNVAIIEIDALREMIDWMPIDRAVPINLENAVSIIRNFAEHNISCIIPYPLSQRNYNNLIDKLSNLNESIYCITLSPPLKNTLTNRGTRELTDWERERIKYHYSIGIHTPSFGEIIDNSEQTPEETVGLILSFFKISNSESLIPSEIKINGDIGSNPHFLGSTVTITIDRPLGSKHPKWGFKYPVNYGYVPNVKSGDGEDLDAYVMGIKESLQEFTGKCIAIIHRLNDNDDKLILAAEGEDFNDEEIREATYFQEQFFKSIILR